MFNKFHRIIITTIIFSSWLFGHCQVPCGIYDDEVSIHQINEHITTIDKAIELIAGGCHEMQTNS